MQVWIRNRKYRVLFDNMAAREVDRFGRIHRWTPEDGFDYGRRLPGGIEDVTEPAARAAIEHEARRQARGVNLPPEDVLANVA